MPDLRELHQAVAALKTSGISGKVYFYASGEHGSPMRHGFISVESGRSCVIDFAKKSNDEALAEIAKLPFIKIVTLPMDAPLRSGPGNPGLDIDALLSKLSPGGASIGGSSGIGRLDDHQHIHRQPDLGESESAIVGMPADAPSASVKLPPSDVEKRLVSLQLLSLQKDATEILERFYGNAAAKKVASIAVLFPPHQKPKQFLDQCRQLAAMMVGADKSNQLFKPLYDKASV